MSNCVVEAECVYNNSVSGYSCRCDSDGENVCGTHLPIYYKQSDTSVAYAPSNSFDNEGNKNVIFIYYIFIILYLFF